MAGARVSANEAKGNMISHSLVLWRAAVRESHLILVSVASSGFDGYA